MPTEAPASTQNLQIHAFLREKKLPRRKPQATLLTTWPGWRVQRPIACRTPLAQACLAHRDLATGMKQLLSRCQHDINTDCEARLMHPERGEPSKGGVEMSKACMAHRELRRCLTKMPSWGNKQEGKRGSPGRNWNEQSMHNGRGAAEMQKKKKKKQKRRKEKKTETQTKKKKTYRGHVRKKKTTKG